MKVCFFNRSVLAGPGGDRAVSDRARSGPREPPRHRGHRRRRTVSERCRAEAAAALGWVTRETREGVDVRRAHGTGLRPSRFAGRASNYFTYFGAATAASFAVGRPTWSSR